MHSPLAVILVFWKIVPEPEKIEVFLDTWKRLMPVPMREELISEFINEVTDQSEVPWITHPFQSCSEYKAFVTVGLWKSANSFEEALSRYFNADAVLQPFEFEARTRTVVTPLAWRIGDYALPSVDSSGTI